MKELITRGELKGLDMAAPWMLASSHPARGIQLYVMGDSGKPVRLDLDVHDAGDLYAALEAHMENVAEAAPITPEERDRALRKGQDGVRLRNLKAVRDEIDRPLRPSDDGTVYAAVQKLVYEWGEAFTDHTAKDPEWIRERIRHDYPHLGEALDRLADLLP